MRITEKLAENVVEGVYWARLGSSSDWTIMHIAFWDGVPFGFIPGTEIEIEMSEISELFGPCREPANQTLACSRHGR